MPNKAVKKCVVSDKQFIEWNQFINQNAWLSNQDTITPIFKNIVAEYYTVNTADKSILSKTYIVSWSPEYKQVFKELNAAWIQTFFEKLEPEDIRQLDAAEENIVKPGGEILFALSDDGTVIGTTAMVLHGGGCELAKMSVREGYKGKGYSHLLMREALAWAKDHGYSTVEILGNTKLESSINLYKKHGFKVISLGKHPLYERTNVHMRWTCE
ncbi:hypothetical protein G6F46_009287 [Rhizopus delemar]|uniref:N-acetyltransferase domain-containing protein n=3 Tax=Rhizopus TaxID=4842 RepID=I1BWA2_RHIO9|nr:hypothetical protein RO3G_05187 [Rhizopus delemar RA 99-880]KAG1455008.1 hypothetical protein G6F55_007308 [Rhizopus delemar]KAG1542255.1 hypothetical protein G6F51_007386 [Rhizopus arrhizus]KAG1493062.1 hypothetical protein G6F54_008857 [Rhizopus delemar]KAG1514985.1 hypothetical protein G6F53_003264 [Rhizopus delemar]|eukprot:EIE80482.1 hypothetical protein RO3G_05187 [Rhizopus delemar RA 99-880]